MTFRFPVFSLSSTLSPIRNENFKRGPEFYKFPDKYFCSRTKDGTLIISWYVPKNKEDIADFLLEIVNITNPQQIFYKKNLPYYMRNEIVKPRFTITVILYEPEVISTYS